MVKRPKIVTDEHLEFLDELQDLGDTNMGGAGRYLEDEFPELIEENVSRFYRSTKSRAILNYWMASFTERHPKI